MSKYPEVEVQLVGEDGNAFAILGRISYALREAEVLDKEIKEFRAEAMSGDYDNLLKVCMEWVTVL